MSTGMIGRAQTVSLGGLETRLVLIEAALLSGLPNFTIVGLPDASVNEAKERLRAGFHHVGIAWPNQRLTINLSPADVSKSGSGFDLGIAVAILEAMGYRVPGSNTYFMGELGLDGSIRRVNGVLPVACRLAQDGEVTLVVPKANYAEASLVAGLRVVGVSDLGELAAMFGVQGVNRPASHRSDVESAQEMESSADESLDLLDVCGQEEALSAMEVAAAGSHHVLMIGPPGIGKSMIAKRMPGILPDLSEREAVEVAAISSVLGQDVHNLPSRPPLASPHHSASVAALVGGGSGIPMPGHITRAHNGVLFLDEFPEFSSRSIQSLRQPMEEGYINLSRSKANVRYPSRFQLIAAANPCKCGLAMDQGSRCTCTSRERRTYSSQLGGPVRDRIDIYMRLTRPSRADLRAGGTVSSSDVALRVREARGRQDSRREDTGVSTNAQLAGRWLRANTTIGKSMGELIDRSLRAGELSMRGVDRILRLAWSIGDLAGRDRPNDDDIAAAFSLRLGM